MAVKTQHKLYTEMANIWERCRDASAGQDAVHCAGPRYLPMLADQSAGEYASYLMRASFYNATWRTIAGLQGMLFRKAAKLEVAAVIEPMMKDVSLCGESLHMFSLKCAEEVLTVGRVGIFVDYPTIDLTVNTEADAKSLGLRPIMKRYVAESIINWEEKTIGNQRVLSKIVLAEEVSVAGANEFDMQEKLQYRVLDLVMMAMPDSAEKLVYRVRVMEEDEKGNDIVLTQEFPQIKGEHLTSLPFYVVGTDNITIRPEMPPLTDLVNINLAHYRTTADYEHGCHFTGLPTPVISGYTPTKDNEKFGIGSMTAWVFPRHDAKASYLEFTGMGLKSLETNLERKETQMAILGARMLQNQQSNGDSQGGAALNAGGEMSLLASASQAISLVVERALNEFSRFAGTSVPAVYRLNKDFFPMPMTALDLTALVASWQNGAINYDTLFENLKRGEVIDVDKTIEEEIANMDKHKPEIPAGTKVNQSNTTGGHETTMQGSSGANPTQRQLQTPKG